MKRVLIPLADGCEELEAVTLIDLLRRAELHVVAAALNEQVVNCSRGTRIIADNLLADVLDEKFDLLILPGGLPGADNLNTDPRIHQLIDKMMRGDQLISAICAAPRVLVSNKSVRNKRLTAFPESLQKFNTDGFIVVDEAVVVDGNIITSKGPGTAMDLALVLIDRLLGPEARRKVELTLQRS